MAAHPRQNEPIVTVEYGSSPDPATRTPPRADRRRKTVVRRFLLRAALWSLAFAAVHLLGFRQYTSILSGTASIDVLRGLCGVTYLLLYAGLAFLVPVLVIAAGLLKAGEVIYGCRLPTSKPAAPSNGGVQPMS